MSPTTATSKAELNLAIEYESTAELTGATWNFQYMVDSVRKRHIIKLGSIEDQDIKIGHNSCEFHVDSVNVSGIRPSRLANVGLLSATLTTREGEEVLTINMVVQVAKTDSDAKFGGKTASDEEQRFTRWSLTHLTDWSLCRSFVSSFLSVATLFFDMIHASGERKPTPANGVYKSCEPDTVFTRCLK